MARGYKGEFASEMVNTDVNAYGKALGAFNGHLSAIKLNIATNPNASNVARKREIVECAESLLSVIEAAPFLPTEGDGLTEIQKVDNDRANNAKRAKFAVLLTAFRTAF